MTFFKILCLLHVSFVCFPFIVEVLLFLMHWKFIPMSLTLSYLYTIGLPLIYTISLSVISINDLPVIYTYVYISVVQIPQVIPSDRTRFCPCSYFLTQKWMRSLYVFSRYFKRKICLLPLKKGWIFFKTFESTIWVFVKDFPDLLDTKRPSLMHSLWLVFFFIM